MPTDPERVALVGFMGAGKSSVGPALAMRLGLAFVDLDQAIVMRTGRTIAQIFAAEGEEGFRRREAEILADSLEGPALVIATGGGIVEAAENRRRLVVEARTVWLDVRFDTVCRRLQQDAGGRERPLLERLGWDGLRALHRRRRPLYASCARWRIDTDRDSAVRVARRLAVALRSGAP
jgi:shikimate kinase